MGQKRWKGSITVFLSISCILFLSLICTAVESVRIQGAKTQSANIMGMGNLSLLSEYENALLENYEIFAIDSTYGSGKFKIQKVNDRLKDYLSANANLKKNFLAELCTDPWRLTLEECEVSEYQLLTDQSGEAFYQQAVSVMKVNAGERVISQLMEYAKDAEKIQNYQESFEEAQKQNDTELSGLETQRQQKLEELQQQAREEQENKKQENREQEVSQELIYQGEAAENKANPLDEIKKLKKKSILSIVTGDNAVSQKKISLKELPSRKITRKGNMKVKAEYSGLSADVLFREYLLMFFTNYLSEKRGEKLDYQIEYLIGGKSSDEANLKETVTRLLLLREGMNYLYCIQNSQMSTEAAGAAAAFTGFLGIPAITTATQHALLLAWAYGESLLDVRILLDGGNIPVNKDTDEWRLSLENLGRITELLQKGAENKGRGMSYQGYLRILLNLGNRNRQKLRALDLIETNLRSEEKTAQFRAENCITAVHTKSEWSCAPVFLSIPYAFMGTGQKNLQFTQEGSISY